MMRTEIYGNGIILKAYEKSFAPMLYEAAVESRAEMGYWLPWCHENYSLQDSEDFIEKTVKNWQNAQDVWRSEMQFGYAIFDAESGKFLGGTGLNRPDKVHKIFNLGYWVRTSAQNRGVASKATRILAKTAFEDLPGLNRIEIVASIENIPSQKAAQKSGATREGILRKRLLIADRAHDAAMFSLVREDFYD